MSDHLFRKALAECRQEVRQAIREIPVDETVLDAFAELFVADFSHILSHPRGAAIWRRDGYSVRRLGRYIGTIAEFYAVAAGHGIVTRTHLTKALQVVRPECKLRALEEGGRRQEYCSRVIFGLD